MRECMFDLEGLKKGQILNVEEIRERFKKPPMEFKKQIRTYEMMALLNWELGKIGLEIENTPTFSQVEVVDASKKHKKWSKKIDFEHWSRRMVDYARAFGN